MLGRQPHAPDAAGAMTSGGVTRGAASPPRRLVAPRATAREGRHNPDRRARETAGRTFAPVVTILPTMSPDTIQVRLR